MPIQTPENKSGGLGALKRRMGVIQGFASGNPATIAAAAAPPESAAAGVIGLGQQIVGMGGAPGAPKTNPMGDGAVGPMPGVRGDAFTRRLRPVAGPGVY